MIEVLSGDALEQLRMLPDESVQCCVSSPPYWGLREYGCEGQLGLEKTPEEYVAKMVAVFREVRRVLRKDGTLWLNLGDSYAVGVGASASNNGVTSEKQASNAGAYRCGGAPGLKPKDLCGIPWRVAFALQADGWWLRSDIIWAKPNPMPESVTDRPTKSHEYIFLLTKSASYFYDAEAIREPIKAWNDGSLRSPKFGSDRPINGARDQNEVQYERICGANKRSVWTIATQPYPEAHFATYPPDLIKPCIMAGTSAKGCCAKCGAPLERVLERGQEVEQRPSWRGEGNTYGVTGGNHAGRTGNWGAEQKTLSWQPTCKCDLNSGVWTGSPPIANGVSRSALLVQHGKEGDYPCQHLKPTARNAEDTTASAKGTRKAALTFQPESAATVPCTVLDPFAGSGTTGAVALELGRRAVLIELNPKYVELIEQRCDVTMGLALA